MEIRKNGEWSCEEGVVCWLGLLGGRGWISERGWRTTVGLKRNFIEGASSGAVCIFFVSHFASGLVFTVNFEL